jgi:hypothetical protein
MDKMVGAFSLINTSEQEKKTKGFGRKVNIAAEHYVRARLCCSPNMEDYEQALLHFMIGLEVLLNPDKGEIIDQLSNRAARLAGRPVFIRIRAIPLMSSRGSSPSTFGFANQLDRCGSPYAP